jgi:hypothetical protein
MNWLELNPILVGAGVTLGARITYVAVDYVWNFTAGAISAFSRGVSLRSAGCSAQQIAEHQIRIAEPHRYITKCRAACPVCTLLGYVEPHAHSVGIMPPQ